MWSYHNERFITYNIVSHHNYRVDGGVSKNDFLCQTLADITGVRVERSKFSESSALGAAFVAGLNASKLRKVISHILEV